MIVSPAPPPEPGSAEKVSRLIADAIDRLPKTAEGIASYFIEVGVKGECADASKCALANYLAGEVAGLSWVGVTLTFVSATTDRGEDIHVRFAQHVGDFIADFDSHVYPSLIAGTS